jgi:DNA-binding CsgD family transcriptional regulator
LNRKPSGVLDRHDQLSSSALTSCNTCPSHAEETGQARPTVVVHDGAVRGPDTDLELGRRSHANAQWLDACVRLSRADADVPLSPGDLELLATSAYMLGRDADYVASLDRAHRGHLDAGDVARAVRCAFWIGHNLLFRGDQVNAGGWFARAQRLLGEQECVERGYLLIPTWLGEMGRGDYEQGLATATDAAAIGERFGDLDLTWLARDEQGRALLNLGRTAEGLRLVDEALISATSGDLSPIVTGIVYCNTLGFCQDALELAHAREWTQALTRWCDRQPTMVEHNGLCQVHRAEVLEIGGAWTDALAAAVRAAERFDEGVLNQLAAGKARYRQGEIRRLRGEFAAAEDAYREASLRGYEPQPGHALLRLAQGDKPASAAAIRRALRETSHRLPRARLLPAFVVIMLANGELDDAATASRELDQTAQSQRTEVLRAQAGYAFGSVKLAAGDPTGALMVLRPALSLWLELDAPYEVARARVLIGLACRALDDEDTALFELDAAHAAFTELDAKPDVERVDALRSARTTYGLTDREVQVLRLVAAGRSNREIAADLVISEHTVARHVQNILAKIDAPSRTAASAFAHQHNLL